MAPIIGGRSRRQAEELILDQRVKVNGTVITSPALNVGPQDKITVDGQLLPQLDQTRLWCYYKPRGVLTTHHDPAGRPTVFEKLREILPIAHLISVGRLDYDSEGLLLLTNDGEMARHLELPSNNYVRVYRVRVHGTVSPVTIERLAAGVVIDRFRYQPVTGVIDRHQGHNSWLTLTLREGKNREVRKIMEHLGYKVLRLIRVQYGPYMLGKLKPGQLTEVQIKHATT